MKRRSFIKGLAAGPVLMSTGLQAGDGMLLPTPPQAEGPFYPVDRIPQVDSLMQAGFMGEELQVSGHVLNLDGSPIANARIDVWQCDAQGIYRHPAAYHGSRMDPAFRGYASITSDADGRYRFNTIKPVPYTGRPPHIHLKFFADGTHQLTTQLYVRGSGGPRRLQLKIDQTDSGIYAANYDFVLNRLA